MFYFDKKISVMYNDEKYKYSDIPKICVVLLAIFMTATIIIFVFLIEEQLKVFASWFEWCWTDFWTQDISVEHLSIAGIIGIILFGSFMTYWTLIQHRPMCDICEKRNKSGAKYCATCGGKLS